MVVDLKDQDDRGEMLDASRGVAHPSKTNDSLPKHTDHKPIDHVRAQDQVATEGYSPQQRRIHWIVAALVAFQLILGILIGTINWQPENHSALRNILIVHLVTGTVIFGLMCKRLSLRRQLGAPPSPNGTPIDAAVLARSNHLGFYVLLLALPILGWLAYLTGGTAAATWGAIHGALAVVLVLAICAHLCGVIFHQYIRRDGLLRRMLD